MRTPIGPFSQCAIEVSDVLRSRTFKIEGHDLINTGEDGLKTMWMNVAELIEYAKVVYRHDTAAKNERLRWRIRLGVFLLQVRAQHPHGSWRRWLKLADVHYRSALRAIDAAVELADSRGEMSTERLRECLQFAEGADVDGITEKDVERRLNARKEYTPKHASRPFTPEAIKAFNAAGGPSWAKGHAPPIPVVIDDIPAPGVTFNRRAFGERVQVSDREVQVLTGPHPNRIGNVTPVSQMRSDSFGVEEVSERVGTVEQLSFEGFYRKAESGRKTIERIDALNAAELPDAVRVEIESALSEFEARIDRAVGRAA